MEKNIWLIDYHLKDRDNKPTWCTELDEYWFNGDCSHISEILSLKERLDAIVREVFPTDRYLTYNMPNDIIDNVKALLNLELTLSGIDFGEIWIEISAPLGYYSLKKELYLKDYCMKLV